MNLVVGSGCEGNCTVGGIGERPLGFLGQVGGRPLLVLGGRQLNDVIVGADVVDAQLCRAWNHHCGQGAIRILGRGYRLGQSGDILIGPFDVVVVELVDVSTKGHVVQVLQIVDIETREVPSLRLGATGFRS